VLLSVLAVFLVPAAAQAQGLGDVAARQREVRQKTGKKPEAAPVFTNHDLDARRPPGSEDESEDAAEPAVSSSSSSSVPDESDLARESYEDRDADVAPQTDAVNQAQAEVDSITRQIRELSSRLNPMSTDYVYGAAASGDAAAEEIRVRNELNQLEARLVEARQELARANDALNTARRGRGSRPVEPQ
jgi:hypothetical protein